MTTKDPTRVAKLAKAQAAAISARGALHDVDLRKCSHDVRAAVKEARTISDDLCAVIHEAIVTDAHERDTVTTP